MNNPPITRRTFAKGLTAGLAATSAVLSTSVAGRAANKFAKADAPKTDQPLNRISELDALYLAPTAWQQSLSQTGALSL